MSLPRAGNNESGLSVGPYSEGIFTLYFEQISDIIEDAGYLGILHIFSIPELQKKSLEKRENSDMDCSGKTKYKKFTVIKGDIAA